jgi:hypothetical protein
MRRGSILQVMRTLTILAHSWQKICMQPMKSPIPLSRLECGGCAVPLHMISWAHFLWKHHNSEHYTDKGHEFLRHLAEKEIAKAWFWQDSATCCHTAQATIRELSLSFWDRIISRGLRASHLLDLSPWHFLYGATLKIMPAAVSHAMWINWKPTYPTSLLTFHPWYCRQCLQTHSIMLSYVRNMLVHTQNFL